MPCNGTVGITHLRSANRTCWQAIVAFAIRARTIRPTQQNPGAQRNAALAPSSGHRAGLTDIRGIGAHDSVMTAPNSAQGSEQNEPVACGRRIG